MYDPSDLADPSGPILSNMSVGPKMPTNSKAAPLKKLSPGMGLYQVMHLPSKAPDSNKPWAIVNLQTGDINGRWHPSKEEALKQARALYAQLGDKAKVHSEVHNAYFLFADAATLVADDGVKWIEAIAPKTYNTPAYGEVVVTPDKINNFVRSVNAAIRGQEVAINYEHGIDPTKGLKAAGWIKQARSNDRGNLELAIDWTEPAKKEIKNGEWKYFSLEWDDEWLHPDGIIYTDVVMGGALTNRPVAKGLMPINFSDIYNEKQFDEYGNGNNDIDVVPENLPDSAFLYVDTDGGRHLPYKDATGCIECDSLQSIVDFLSQSNAGSNWPGFTDPMRQMCLRTALALQQQSNNDDDDDYDGGIPSYSYGERLFAVWDTAYVNNLPDSAFAYIEPGGKKDSDGKTTPRSLRHFPYKDANGSVDLAHVRNMIARAPQANVPDSVKNSVQGLGRKLLSAAGSSNKGMSEEKELEHSAPGSGTPPVPRYADSGIDDDAVVNGWRREIPESTYTDPPQVGALYDQVENGEVVIRYSEAEAVGYLSAAVNGLKKIHTNKGDKLIEDIKRLLAINRNARSFNELQRLTNEVRSYLRSTTNGGSNSGNGITNRPEGGSAVGELTENDVRELRNVLGVEDDGRIVEAVKTKFGELAALRDAVTASDQERVFAEQYPQFYSEHLKLVEEQRKSGAKNFSESIQKIKRAEGFGLKTTKQGLSTAALEKVEGTYLKFAEGKATVSDFEDCIRAIVNGGIVTFGEVGSSQEDEIPEVDTTGPLGIANARKVFSEVVARIQTEHPDWSYQACIAEASKKSPDLAEAYKITLPA